MSNISREPLVNPSNSHHIAIASNHSPDHNSSWWASNKLKVLSAIILIIAWLTIPFILNNTQDGPVYQLTKCEGGGIGTKRCPSGGTELHPCCSGPMFQEIRCTDTYCWSPIFGEWSMYAYFIWSSPFFIILSIVVCCRIMNRNDQPPSTYTPLYEMAMAPLSNDHRISQAG